MINAITPVRAPLFGQVAPAAAVKTDVPEALQAELKAKGIKVTPDTEYTKHVYKGAVPTNVKELVKNEKFFELYKTFSNPDNINWDKDIRSTVIVYEFDSADEAKNLFKHFEMLSESGIPFFKLKNGTLHTNYDSSKFIEQEGITPKKSPELYAIKGLAITGQVFIGNNPKQIICYSLMDTREFNRHAPQALKDRLVQRMKNEVALTEKKRSKILEER